MNKIAWDAVVVGSGPNGLAAAIELSRNGLKVLVVEGSSTLGGGVRSAEWTLPGIIHDTCSSIYPMAVSSPFFRSLPLVKHGLEWIDPEVLMAHPLDDGSAAVLERSLAATAEGLGSDRDAYLRLMGPLVEQADHLFADLLGPLRISPRLILGMRFGWRAIRSGRGLAESYFKTPRAHAFWAGIAAHAVLPLEQRPGAAIALVLALAGHAYGWPLVKGGAQRLTAALVSYFRSLGGEIISGERVESLESLPAAKVTLLDLTPRQIIAVAGKALPLRYLKRLARFRYGPGIFKIDWALSGAIPWTNPRCRRAGTLHIGGTLNEIARSEREAVDGIHSERPYVLFAQPTVADPSRAPEDRHIAWGYCHVPNGSTVDMTARIEAQVERFAPGFRDLILARHIMNTEAMEQYNPNYIGGDIAGGVTDFYQLFTRPVARLDPYSTPNPALFICSSSTPPGGGVHGMCGYFAARSAIKRLRRM